MPTFDERLASLEAKVEAMAELRSVVADVRGDMNGRFEDVNQRKGRRAGFLSRPIDPMRWRELR